MPLPKTPRRKTLLSPAPLPPLPPLHHKHRVTKLPLTVSISVFLAIVAVAIGTMATLSMQRDDEMLRSDINRVQQEVLNRLTHVEETCLTPPIVKPINNPVSTTTSAALPVTVTAQQLNEMRVQIQEGNWNNDSTNETVEYRDTQRGVLMRLPYNQKWGNATYKLAPYEVEGDTIHYGPIVMNTRGSETTYSRMYDVQIVPSRSVKDIEKFVGVNPSTPSTENNGVTRVKAGNFEVYKIDVGLEGAGALEFLGKRYNYIFSKLRGGELTASYAPEINETLPIIRSLKSI